MELFQERMQDDFERRKREVKREFNELPDEAIESESPEEICERIASNYDFSPAPEIDADGVSMDDPVVGKGGLRAEFTIYIPFKGHKHGFLLYHSSRPVGGASYDVRRNELVRVHEVPGNNVEVIKGRIEEDIKFLNRYLANVRDMVPRFNKTLRQFAKEEFEIRRYELRKRKEASRAVSGLGIPIRKRQDNLEEVIVPVKRKPIRIEQPREQEKKEPNYILGMAVYEEILKSISSMVMVMERTPSVFTKMEEEPLRTILLVGLNGLYEGKATGETFNGKGKLDILIRDEDK